MLYQILYLKKCGIFIMSVQFQLAVDYALYPFSLSVKAKTSSRTNQVQLRDIKLVNLYVHIYSSVTVKL